MTTLEEQSGRERAHALAAAAAGAAGTTVRPLDGPYEAETAAALLRSVWEPIGLGGLVEPEVIRTLAHAGNCAFGAFQGERMVGVALGFLGFESGTVTLRSYIVGVEEEVRHRAVGYALKLAQRAWALERGIASMLWTADPLVRRNAHFNLMKLGARVDRYENDFYQRIGSSEPADRILLRWSLEEPLPLDGATAPRDLHAETLAALGATVVLDADERGRPGDPVAAAADAPALIFVPRDIGALRRESPELARSWRTALRRALAEQLDAGRTIGAITRDGYYVAEAAA